MKVLVLTRYASNGASSRLRFFQYFPYLKRHSIEIVTRPLFDESYLLQLYEKRKRSFTSILGSYFRRLKVLLTIGRYDYIWIQGELFPWLPAISESLLAGFGVPYIVDYDDAIFHNYDNAHSKLVRVFLGKKIDIVMRNAHIVVAGNAYIASRAREAGAKHVVTIPTVVDLQRYGAKQERRPAICFNVGWIGSLSTAKYLDQMKEPLKELCKELDIMFTMVGIKGVEFENVNTREVVWTEHSEVESIKSFDVGIMPLPDTNWAKGKCGYKLIQYMACGIPVLASSVGVNSQIVEHGVDGFLVSSQSEWVKFLKILEGDPDLRSSMGKRGRKKIENHYSLQAMEPRILNLFGPVRRFTGKK